MNRDAAANAAGAAGADMKKDVGCCCFLEFLLDPGAYFAGKAEDAALAKAGEVGAAVMDNMGVAEDGEEEEADAKE